MPGQNYRCYGKTLRPPEDGEITCQSNSWIVKEKVKCKLACSRGKPSHEIVECKLNVGWRPTHKVTCEGVGPGVIIGVLLGGLAAVVIIAIAYAKFKQYQKKKHLKKHPPPPKNTQRRPGGDTRPGKKLITGVENERGHVPTAAINKSYAHDQAATLPNNYQSSENSRESIPSQMSSPRERDVPPKPGARQQAVAPEIHRSKSKDPGSYYQHHPHHQQRPKSVQGYGSQGAYYEDNVQFHADHNTLPAQYGVGYGGYEQQQHPSTSGYGSMRGYDDYRGMQRPPSYRSAHYDKPYNVQT